jgi:hypothetical protein
MLARLQFRLPVPVNSKDPPEGTLPKGAGTANSFDLTYRG